MVYNRCSYGILGCRMTWAHVSFYKRIALDLLIFTCVLLSALLFYVFYEKGGKIQKIVLDKRGTRFIRSAVSLISFMRLSYYTLNNTMIYQCQQLGSLLVYYVVENWRLRQWLKTTN